MVGINTEETEFSISISHIVGEEILSSQTRFFTREGLILPERIPERIPEKDALETIPKKDTLETIPQKNNDTLEILPTKYVETVPPTHISKEKSDEDDEDENYSRLSRIGVESAANLGLIGAGALFTYLVLQGNKRNGLAFLGILMPFALSPLTVHHVGESMGGEGKLWATYIGELVGLGSGIFIIGMYDFNVLTGDGADIWDYSLFVFSLSLPFVGSIVGYEMSHDAGEREASEWSMGVGYDQNTKKLKVGLRLDF